MKVMPIPDYVQSKSEAFIEEIKRMVKIRHPLADENGLPTMNIPGTRTSMGTQGHNAAVIAHEMIDGRNVLLSGETGSGKTHTVIKAIMMADAANQEELPSRILVLCPGQIAKKWANEEIPADDPKARTYIVDDAFELIDLLKIEKILDCFQLDPENAVNRAMRETGMSEADIMARILKETGNNNLEQLQAYAKARTRLWVICDEQKLKNSYRWEPAWKTSYRYFFPERIVPKEPELKKHALMPCARPGCKLHDENDESPHHGIMQIGRARIETPKPDVQDKYVRIPVCPTCHTAITKWDRKRKIFVLMTDEEARASRRLPVCIYCGEAMWRATGTQAYDKARYITCYREWEEHVQKTLKAHKTIVAARAYVPTDDNRLKNDMAQFSQGRSPFKDRGKKQISVAEALMRWNYGLIKRAVIDEMHQYKALNSARGIAAGQVASLAETVVAMTGTLMGGYSTTLMYIMLRFSGGLYEDFPYGKSESRWIDRFGYHRTKWTEKPQESYTIGKGTKRKNNKRTSESPGITPDLLKMMLSSTVFIHIADVSSDLPDYEELVLPVQMSELTDPESGLSQREAYERVEGAVVDFVKATLKEGSARGIGLVVTKLRPYASMVEKGIEIYDPQPDAFGKKKLIVKVPPVLPYEEPNQMWPKEHELVAAVKQNIEHGRKSLIYVENTDKLDITPRIKEIMERSGVSAGILKADTVNLRNRGEWLMKNADKWQALICSPKLVEMGMDLNKYGFTNIIWYQMVYSSYTVGQASKRSYRIGQTEDCTVMFLTYDDTVEMNALRLVAQKIQVTEALEGKLSSGEFTTYVDDMNTALARELLDKVKAGSDDIQSILSNQEAEVQDQFIGIEKIVEEAPVIEHAMDEAPETETLVLPEAPKPREQSTNGHSKEYTAKDMAEDMERDGRDFKIPVSVNDFDPLAGNTEEEIEEAKGYEKAVRLDMFSWAEQMKQKKTKRSKAATKEQPSLFEAFGV